ncbi:MAG: BatD family protein, partial [Candidatus Omnitrophica bacterium]|nr:BatD family protein [Candidatus Omnitrophota bacterium]
EMTILPFPEKDRPLDFRGAVGDFSMETHCEPRKVRVGDPLTVRMIITGTGNMDTVTAPEVKDGEDFKIYEPQVTKKERMKTYEQIIIPKTDEMKEIPGISFSFFDPRTGRYKTIEEPPLPVEVAARPESEKAVKIVSMAGKEQMFYPPEKLGQDIIHIKENIGDLREKGGFFYNNIFFWAGQLVPLGFLLAFYAAHRRKEKIRTDRRYARSLEAPAGAKRGIRKAGMCLRKNDAAGFYDAVFRTLQEYLGNKFDMAGGSITAQVVEDKLRPAGCDENVLRQIREVFAGCDMVRYASAIPGGEKAKEVLEKVRKIIDSLERTRL